MKRIISAVLCAVIVFASLCITTPAAVTDVHFTDASAVSAVGATVSYDEYLGAVKVRTDGTGATLTLDGAEGYIAAWIPASYNIDSITITADSSVAALAAGHKFVSVPAGEEIVLPAADSAYTVYFYGFGPDADEIVAAANGSLNEFDEEFLDLSEYEVERYTKYFWDGDIVFNESFFPVEEKDGSIAPINLMYDVDRVVSVKNSYLNLEYTYGEDYYIENGQLILTPETSMLVYRYDQIYADIQKNSTFREMIDGGYATCGQQMMFFTGYCNITYTPANEWGGVIPESKGYLLPKTTAKLNTPGETLRIMSIGDSLAGGANASASNGTLPYADIWRDMVPKALQIKYPDVDIVYDTIAQGGATASLAIERMYSLLAFEPDIVFIEFGTNECMNGESPWASGGYIDTLNRAIASINNALPDCEIVLVAPIISHPVFFPTDWFYTFADSLYSIEREGVVVADSTSLYQFAMSEKRYIDMTGDHLCHPSDFGTRLFVHTILKALEEGSEEEYIAGLADRITNYRYENEFLPEQWEEICSLAAEASLDIADETTVDAARALYLHYAAEIDAIPNAKEIAEGASVDTEKLVFNYKKTADTVDQNSLVNVAVRYDDSEKAIVSTVTNARKPAFNLNYSVGNDTLYAENYSYAVVTCMEPTSNGTRAKTTNFSFIVNGEELSALSVDQQKDDKYHSYVLDLTGLEGFEGTIDGLKVAVYASASVNDALYLSSVILCADEEEARDLAVERERDANGDAAVPVTYLCGDDVSCAILTAAGEEILCGDADGDGVLRAKDLLLIRKYLAGDTETVLTNSADVDHDGQITASDVVLLRRTLAGIEEAAIVKDGAVAIEFDSANEAAKLTFSEEKATVTADLTDAFLFADMFKYVTLCTKTADGSAMEVTITVTTENGTATDTVIIEESDSFTAYSAKFTTLTGNITSVSFTFDNAAGDVVFFDSFVLTPTYSAAQNAETVRVGAANLI